MYLENDNLNVKYVCTSAVYKHADFAVDVYYDEIGYFGIYPNIYSDNAMCTAVDCDGIEKYIFNMIEGVSGWEYSQHKNDTRKVGNHVIDGGRSFTHIMPLCAKSSDIKSFIIRKGEFIRFGHEK